MILKSAAQPVPVHPGCQVKNIFELPGQNRKGNNEEDKQ